MTVRGIGVDIADVARFRRLLNGRGTAFAAKWFQAEEIARCEARADVAAAFAECFAAKEAAWKALGPGPWSAPLPWQDIVVAGDPRRGVRVVLAGAARALAGERCELRVTAASTASIATATAIAIDAA